MPDPKDQHETPDLIVRARAALVAQGSSLAGWCRDHDLNRAWVYRALAGKRNGPSARALRDAFIQGDYDKAAQMATDRRHQIRGRG